MNNGIISQLKDSKVALVGLGMTGMSMLRFLLRNDIVPDVFDANAIPPAQSQHHELFEAVNAQFGPIPTKQFADYDVVLISPGVSLQEPSIRYAREMGIEVYCDIELFARINTTPVIAVTGSNGKSTVVAWLTDFLQQVGLKAIACGNYGVPVLDVIDDNASVFVIELSSFQLDTTQSLECMAATVLNVTPDHLDRYDSFEHYAQSKRKIYQHAQVCLFNADDPQTHPTIDHFSIGFGTHIPAKPLLWSYNPNNGDLLHHQRPFANLRDFILKGHHNAMNALVVAAMASVLDVDVVKHLDKLMAYQGLIHRCQHIAGIKGIRFVDDSKATNIASTMAAINGLAEHKNIVLIAGGDAKGSNLSELIETISANVKKVIAIGKDKAQFKSFVAPRDLTLVEAPSITNEALNSEGNQAFAVMQYAVRKAFDAASPGDIVLLSPACASIDMFQNYQARAAAFKAAVQQIKLEAGDE